MAHFSRPHPPHPFPLIVARPGDRLQTIDRDIVIECLKLFGGVLFRSFPIGLEGFHAFVQSYSKRRIKYPAANRGDVSSEYQVQTAPGFGALRLHSELSHSPFRPDLCWFYCVRRPSLGGETLFCDGSLLVAHLAKGAAAFLQCRMLRYTKNISLQAWQQLAGVSAPQEIEEFFNVDPRAQCFEVATNQVRQDFITPILHFPKFIDRRVFANNILYYFRKGMPLRYPTLDNGSLLPEKLICEIDESARKCTYELHWRDNDLLILDNTRFMHGRRKVIDPNRVLWTQFSYANF
jgi:alpha-ketoglutarate-dependent taurine dioxygenase